MLDVPGEGLRVSSFGVAAWAGTALCTGRLPFLPFIPYSQSAARPLAGYSTRRCCAAPTVLDKLMAVVGIFHGCGPWPRVGNGCVTSMIVISGFYAVSCGLLMLDV